MNTENIAHEKKSAIGTDGRSMMPCLHRRTDLLSKTSSFR